MIFLIKKQMKKIKKKCIFANAFKLFKKKFYQKHLIKSIFLPMLFSKKHIFDNTFSVKSPSGLLTLKSVFLITLFQLKAQVGF